MPRIVYVEADYWPIIPKVLFISSGAHWRGRHPASPHPKRLLRDGGEETSKRSSSCASQLLPTDVWIEHMRAKLTS